MFVMPVYQMVYVLSSIGWVQVQAGADCLASDVCITGGAYDEGPAGEPTFACKMIEQRLYGWH